MIITKIFKILTKTKSIEVYDVQIKPFLQLIDLNTKLFKN